MMGGGDQKGVCVQHVGENSSSMARRSLLSMRERNTLDANPNPHERKLKYAKKRGEGGVCNMWGRIGVGKNVRFVFWGGAHLHKYKPIDAILRQELPEV